MAHLFTHRMEEEENQPQEEPARDEGGSTSYFHFTSTRDTTPSSASGSFQSDDREPASSDANLSSGTERAGLEEDAGQEEEGVIGIVEMEIQPVQAEEEQDTSVQEEGTWEEINERPVGQRKTSSPRKRAQSRKAARPPRARAKKAGRNRSAATRSRRGRSRSKTRAATARKSRTMASQSRSRGRSSKKR